FGEPMMHRQLDNAVASIVQLPRKLAIKLPVDNALQFPVTVPKANQRRGAASIRALTSLRVTRIPDRFKAINIQLLHGHLQTACANSSACAKQSKHQDYRQLLSLVAASPQCAAE